MKLRPHVVYPECRVLVRVAKFHAAEMIELEMVMSVQKAGENESAFDVDHDVGALGGRVDSKNPAREPDGGGDAPFGRDSRVDQRYRAPPHEGFTF
jgi:hypothetical protein